MDPVNFLVDDGSATIVLIAGEATQIIVESDLGTVITAEAGTDTHVITQEDLVAVVSVSSQGPPGRDGVGGGQTYWEPEALQNLGLGQIVYSDPLGRAGLASAGGVGRDAVGVVTRAALATIWTQVQLEGMCVLADWSASTGSPALIPGQEYWLSTTSGMLSPTPPTGQNVSFQKIGRALLTTTLAISVEKFGRR